MKHYTLFIYIIASVLLSACVDKFEADLPQEQTHLLVVEGDIYSQQECSFMLSHTVGLDANESAVSSCMITDASLSVRGDDGQAWSGTMSEPGKYVVSVGALSADAHYWVNIDWGGNSYASEPLSPLATPDIVSLAWEQPRSDRQVDILITPASTFEAQYFRWSYEEHWEINTPMKTIYEYIPTNDDIEMTHPVLHQGWCHQSAHRTVIAGSADYSNHNISNLRIYQLSPLDDRFNTRYCTCVTQTAITREQYEYEKLSLQLSDEMGGLFTPQPAALPSNVKCQTADRPAIGFVGVSLNNVSKTLYIDNKEVGHQSQHLAQTLPDSEARRYSWSELWQMGYRVYQYYPEFSSVTWVSRWCVDCTDSTWGASLQRPDFWQD